MMLGNRIDKGTQELPKRFHELGTDGGVLLDDFVLGVGQTARLVQDLAGDLHLPDVMQQGRPTKFGPLFCRESHFSGNHIGVGPGTFAVASGIAIMTIESCNQDHQGLGCLACRLAEALVLHLGHGST